MKITPMRAVTVTLCVAIPISFMGIAYAFSKLLTINERSPNEITP